MTKRGKDILFIAIVVAAVAVLYILSITGRKAPDVPADKAHAGLTAKEQCFPCHAEGMPNALKKEHPPKDQCFECHKVRTGSHGY